MVKLCFFFMSLLKYTFKENSNVKQRKTTFLIQMYRMDMD